ncbi:MAG: Bis(5'-nucleosyl)-tetraphosphatase [asymmetrical] (Diadenosine 5',5'''-P1,P4-tetraphosphate asymmetrical hydrolase) (Diadenosine tetraphosphatase) (Ap4A hydrolase) (Ap4Aase) (Nucleoside diphosphate-linked moiety X motif 2) (Nudix motif 2) [Parcubacteria group bacterium Gr01-1014_20]|nr:MAG: Bis(5'-nucleosyl)-tetraphosphatase [asymmetrical] (Diadenosine 5',5'''-P1,P4-tetraphosphate asymmetrical hydrolase) (Diadenosine tetraphosphatase) (Ap4A hydrolase) (Ap4Aase) (Nucleoside diphosphate-linked moiety X motif 2) (Nudix motif 2) [Parcubacteria group bacterium Gr01-1014_20]
MDQEISAGIVVYRRTQEGPKFLVLYHGHNYWNFAKGKIESEEKSFAAALRETREETGLGEKDLRITRNFKAYERFHFRRSGKQVFKIVIFYMAETTKHEIKISHEHQGYAWFLYNEAKGILGKYKDSQKVLRKAYEHLRPKSDRSRPANPQRPNPNLPGGGAPRRIPPSVPGSR